MSSFKIRNISAKICVNGGCGYIKLITCKGVDAIVTYSYISIIIQTHFFTIVNSKLNRFPDAELTSVLPSAFGELNN